MVANACGKIIESEKVEIILDDTLAGVVGVGRTAVKISIDNGGGVVEAENGAGVIEVGSSSGVGGDGVFIIDLIRLF